MDIAIKHPMPHRDEPSFEICDIRALWRSGLSVRVPSDAQGWASECPDVTNYKWRLNPVRHRMLYLYSNSGGQRVNKGVQLHSAVHHQTDSSTTSAQPSSDPRLWAQVGNRLRGTTEPDFYTINAILNSVILAASGVAAAPEWCGCDIDDFWWSASSVAWPFIQHRTSVWLLKMQFFSICLVLHPAYSPASPLQRLWLQKCAVGSCDFQKL